MYLKALEIQGFKSFPDKTVLNFGEDITAIVGPNGSGKSNISDAIRWVMGEQNSRQLRGAKMEDVIFGGTEKRNQMGFAQVTLVIDNTEHIFPTREEAEVAVTRRYYRSGESEYYINKQSVRLKDVNELFMDTGMGREGYSIIGQGKIDNIRKFLRYLLSSNVGEVFTVFLGVVFAGFLGIRQPETVGVTVPLLATQLLWINLLTDAAPALAMGVDPQTDDVMGRKPRKVTDRVIDASMWGDIIYIGVIMAIVTLIGMDMHLSGGLFTDRSVDATGHEAQMTEARTMGFTILVFAQLFNALASRSHLQSAFVGLFSNKWLWGAIALSMVLQLAVIYIPFLNTAFGTVPLSVGAWVECLGLAMIVLIASELRKCVLRAR